MITFGTPRITVASNFAPFLIGNALVDAGLKKIADQILSAAQTLVPRDTGSLANSGRVMVDSNGWVHVVFGEGLTYAVYVEFGTSDTPTFAFLRRAAESVMG